MNFSNSKYTHTSQEFISIAFIKPHFWSTRLFVLIGGWDSRNDGIHIHDTFPGGWRFWSIYGCYCTIAMENIPLKWLLFFFDLMYTSIDFVIWINAGAYNLVGWLVDINGWWFRFGINDSWNGYLMLISIRLRANMPCARRHTDKFSIRMRAREPVTLNIARHI